MYITLAQIYDRMTKDVNYVQMADFVVQVFHQNDVKPELVLDLGCGTGSLCVALAKHGYEMIGVDISPEMLHVASEKNAKLEKPILYLLQDIRSFELYGTVGAILASLDVLNHITKKRELLDTLKWVNNYLDPGGLFLFDMNSEYKLTSVIPDQTYYQVEEDVAWIWNNTYNKQKRICKFDLTFFIKNNQNTYDRFDEDYLERAWCIKEIQAALQLAGLELLHVYDEFTFNEPNPKSERLFFVARKPLSS